MEEFAEWEEPQEIFFSLFYNLYLYIIIIMRGGNNSLNIKTSILFPGNQSSRNEARHSDQIPTPHKPGVKTGGDEESHIFICFPTG